MLPGTGYYRLKPSAHRIGYRLRNITLRIGEGIAPQRGRVPSRKTLTAL